MARSKIMGRMLILAILAALALAGCGGNTAQVEQQQVTLRFGVSAVSASPHTLEPLLAPAIERFQQETPHITVEMEAMWYSLASGQAQERLSRIDAFLGLADTVRSAPGALSPPAPLNLEPVIAGTEGFNEEDFFPHVLDAFRRDGALYGVPVDVDLAVVYYNRDMFDALGVPYPQPGWTWQDFLEAAQQLTTIQGEDEVQTGHWGFVSEPQFGEAYLFVLQHGGAPFDDPFQPTRFVFDDPRVAEAIQWYADLALVHKVMPTPHELEQYRLRAADLFASQKAALWIGGVSARGGAGAGGFWGSAIPWDFAWGAASLPRDEAESNWIASSGYFVAEQTPHPQEAWALVKSLSEHSEYGVFLGVPARRAMAESVTCRQRLGTELADLVFSILDSDHLVLVPSFLVGHGDAPDLHSSPLTNAFWHLSADVVNGYITAEEMMDRLRTQSAERTPLAVVTGWPPSVTASNVGAGRRTVAWAFGGTVTILSANQAWCVRSRCRGQ